MDSCFWRCFHNEKICRICGRSASNAFRGQRRRPGWNIDPVPKLERALRVAEDSRLTDLSIAELLSIQRGV